MRRSGTHPTFGWERSRTGSARLSIHNILPVEKQEVPGETRGTGIPNHSPQSSHHQTSPYPKPPPSSLHLLLIPPNTRLASYAPPPIHSQRKSPVALAVAMFSSVYSRNGAEEERQKCARDEVRGRAARSAQVILLCDRVPEPEKWRRTRKASSLLRTWSGSVVAAQSWAAAADQLGVTGSILLFSPPPLSLRLFPFSQSREQQKRGRKESERKRSSTLLSAKSKRQRATAGK